MARSLYAARGAVRDAALPRQRFSIRGLGSLVATACAWGLLATLVCLPFAAAIPPCCGPSHTNCGYKPTQAAPCGAQCPVTGSDGTCASSCGHQCTTDDDCGAWPYSPCSACQRGRCTGNAEFGNCTQAQPWQPGTPQAPVLPQAWNASFVMTNYTNFDGQGNQSVPGFMYYDSSVGGLRQDYPEGACPFVELQPGLKVTNANHCSMLFLRGYNYYIYGSGVPRASTTNSLHARREPTGRSPAATAGGSETFASDAVCCKYHFPNWTPDSYRVANASFGGTSKINGVNADYWRFSYSCAWTRPQPPGPWPARLPALTVQRDLWTTAGGNVPVRMNETLTSGYTDFHEVMTGPQDVANVFDGYLARFDCIDDTDPGFARVCNRYNARGRLGYLGFT